MRIKYLSPQGVLEVEQGALRELEKCLPSTWGAFAAFRLVTRGSKVPLDIDLLLLTTNRILVVELKNWAGNIEYTSGQWVHKGKPHKSPVEVNDNKARALKAFIREKYATIKVPFIESLVLLCHPTARLVRFPDEQRRFVMMLSDFAHAGADPTRYKKCFPDMVPGMHYPSSNPLEKRQQYDALFSNSNPGVLQRRAVVHGFEQIDTRADYEHPRKIWSEFNAEHQENRSSKALLRRWNFDELAGGGTSAVERQTIGLRELRLNETLRAQAPELHADLLEPIGSAAVDDITTNFVEAYRLPTTIERLADHLARNGDMPFEGRRSLAKSILSRFAKLHTLGIAHRDVTSRTLWVVEPSRVILSTFAAARIPESRTVGVHRFELETGSIELPEDSDKGGSKQTSDPFARDVFLLGVLVYEMLERVELERVNCVPLYDSNVSLKVAALASWYAKSMDWEPSARYETASESLDALNDCFAEISGPEVSAADLDAYYTEASPFTLPTKRLITQSSSKMVYESEREGAKVLVKCWPQLRFDEKYGARNLRLLTFLQQARSLRQSAFNAAPEVLDFGIGQFGLMLVTQWVDGDTLPTWLGTNPSGRRRALVALGLLNAVRRLHVLGLAHGDVKSENIVVAAGEGDEEDRVVLVDIPDLSADGDAGITIGSVPSALEAASPQHRDAFAAATLTLTLLLDEFPSTRRDVERALELADALPPLDLLAETLQTELSPRASTVPSYQVTLKRRSRQLPPAQELVGNNDEFLVRVVQHAETGDLRFFLVGVRQELFIKFDPVEEVVLDAGLKGIDHQDFVRAHRTKTFALKANIHVKWDDELDASILSEVLLELYRGNADDEVVGASVQRHSEDPYSSQRGQVGLTSVSAVKLWNALANTDEMNVTAISVRAGVQQFPPDSGQWVIPFDAEGGVLDFSEDEKIELLERGLDPVEGTERWYRVGYVSPDIGRDVMKVSGVNMRFKPQDGETYYVRGTLERLASERRVTAMKRVLANGALIPHIVDYFDPDTERMPKADEHLDLGDLTEYGLNPLQEEALRTAVTFGPVSLLQGPPGTGKTKFIASFVHMVLSQGLAGNILLVSQSHEAVNNAMNKVADLVGSSALDVSMVRLGLPSMTSPALRNIQEDSLRQGYRETFDAELKERVRSVGYAMGLPEQYVRAATELHSSLGALLERLNHLDEGQDGGVSEHAYRLREVFVEIAAARFGVLTAANENLSNVLETKLNDLAQEHGALSPAKCERFRQIAKLSTEFSQVLRSPRSNFTSFLARSSNVVAGTCVGVGKQALGIADVPYDWVIVDEAARASPMELVVAMQVGKRVLLVGDHLQLPPSYPRAVEKQAAQILGVSRKDFRRINNFQRAFSSKYGQAVGRTMRIQYRMAASINRLVSHCFYNDALEVGRAPPGPEYEKLPSFMQKQVVWVDTQDHGRGAFHRDAGTSEGALVNEAEALAVVDVVRAIVRSEGFINQVRSCDGDKEPVIGIIAMYAAQRDLIRRKLEQADWAVGLRDTYSIGTVDSYQGKENRIIVLSVVRNNPSDPSVGFLIDPERINVAMSRAKDRLVIVSSTPMWQVHEDTPMKRVFDEVVNLEKAGEAALVLSKGLKRSFADA